MKVARRAPATPISMVMKMPPGSFPGMMSLANAPTIRPMIASHNRLNMIASWFAWKTAMPRCRAQGVCARCVGYFGLPRPLLDFGQVLGRLPVQSSQQLGGGGGSWYCLVENNGVGGNSFAIKILIGVVVGAQSGTGQRDSGKETACARVGQDLGPQSYIRLRGGIAANRAGCRRGVSTDLNFALKYVCGRSRAHEQEDEIGSLSTQLKSEARAFQSHHAGRTPGTAKVPATAASQHAATVAGSDNEGGLEDGRQYDYAIRFVDHTLRDVVGNVHNFGNYSTRGHHSIRFLVLSKRGQNH